MKAVKLLAIAVIFLGIGMIGNVALDMLQLTRAEVITICEELIKGDTLSIFDKQTAGRLESCLYTLIEIEYIQITKPQLWRLRLWKLRRQLEIHLRWLADREEQRQEMARDKHEEER